MQIIPFIYDEYEKSNENNDNHILLPTPHQVSILLSCSWN